VSIITGEDAAGAVVEQIAKLGGAGVYEVIITAFVRDDGSFSYAYSFEQTSMSAPVEGQVSRER
jgi:hypothetical protein